MPGLSPTLRNALRRIADGSQRAMDVMTSWRRPLAGVRMTSAPPPPHVEARLEQVFDALADLPLQSSIGAAFELAGEALASELPTATMAVGLHDIDEDQMRFVVAQGAGEERIRGVAMPVAACFPGPTAYEIVLTHGGADGARWIASEDDRAPVLLCPIVHEQTLLGLVALAEPMCAADFGKHDIALVRYVSDQLGSFIHDFRLRPPSTTLDQDA